MASTVSDRSAARHLLLPDKASLPAKAQVRKADEQEWRSRVGQVIERIRTLSGLQLQQFADAVDRDERQVYRWIHGQDRPHFDAVLAVSQLQRPAIIALAEAIIGTGVELETVIRIRDEKRSA